MIPNIIHQIFISNNKLVKPPKLWLSYGKIAKHIHPSWQYLVWNKDNLKNFIAQNYPKLMHYFEDKIPAVIQSDIARCALLHHFGGWYIDYDYEMLKPLDAWKDKNLILPISRYPSENEQFDRISNAIIASAPKHYIWKLVLDSLPSTDIMNEQITHEEILKIAGPTKLTSLYDGFSKNAQKEITLPEREVFHHPLPQLMDAQQYKKLRHNPHIYGLHHTHSSWRDKELRKNLRRRKFGANIVMRPIMLSYVKLKAIFTKRKS